MKVKQLTAHLKKRIMKIPRHKHHKILHHIHKKHRLSKKTLFYMKEYGPKSHLVSEIIKDSMPVLLLSVLLTSFAGLALRSILDKLLFLVPLVIMIPALNDMIGDMGSVIASKFTTALFLGKVKGSPWRSSFVKNLFNAKIKVALASAVYLSLLALFFSLVKGFKLDVIFASKIILTGIVSAVVIASIIFIVVVVIGIKIFKREEDPNNFLIPISTSIADVVTLVMVSLLAILLF